MANISLGTLEFQTRREEMRDQTKFALKQIMNQIGGDAVILAEVVAGGPSMWRGVFLSSTRGLAVNDGIADKLYVFFCELSKRRIKEFGIESGDAKEFLDRVELPSKLTEQEIEDAWEVDVQGHEDAIRQFYVDQPQKTLPKKVRINGRDC